MSYPYQFSSPPSTHPLFNLSFHYLLHFPSHMSHYHSSCILHLCSSFIIFELNSFFSLIFISPPSFFIHLLIFQERNKGGDRSDTLVFLESQQIRAKLEVWHKLYDQTIQKNRCSFTTFVQPESNFWMNYYEILYIHVSLRKVNELGGPLTYD